MQSRVLWCQVAVLMAVLLLASPAVAANTVLDGEYSWDNGGSGALEARFKDQGEGSWKVAFHFVFQGKKRVWKGFARGQLGVGELRGEVRWGDRVFLFEGQFEDGTFVGTHSEDVAGEEFLTGTLKLGK